MEKRDIFGADARAVAGFWGTLAGLMVGGVFAAVSFPLYQFATGLGLPAGWLSFVVGGGLFWGTWWAVQRWIGGEGRQGAPR